MAAAAGAAAEAPNVDSYIGSLIGLVTKSEIRYEGFLFHLNAQETTIGLRNVKSFGTEGRRNDGPQVPPSNKIYEYIFFRGSDIKDLQVISSPPLKSTPSLPDDPAIIQSHFSHPASTPISFVSSGAAQVSAFSSNAQSGFRVPSPLGNPALHQSLENPASLGSSLPALHVNNNRPAMRNYWPGIPGSSGGISQFQHQNYPPPPQGLVVSHPVHQQSDVSTMNAPLATNAVNIVEPPHSLMPPVCTGSPNVIPPMLPSSATQSNLGLFSLPVFNLSPVLLSNNISSSPATLTMNTTSQLVSSSVTSLNLTSTVAPVCEAARSVISPALPYPSMSLSAKYSTETLNSPLDKTPQPSSLTSSPLLQPNLMEVSPSHSSHNVNNSTEHVQQSSKSERLLPESEIAVEPRQQRAKPPSVSLTSSPLLQSNLKDASLSHSSRNMNNSTELAQSLKSKPLLRKSENAAEPGQRMAKPPAKTMHGAASSSHYHDRKNLRGMRDEMHEDVVNTRQGGRSHVQGRVNGLYGAASHSHYGHRNRPIARGHKLNGPLHTHQNHRSLGGENGPNGISLHGRRLGRFHANGGSKVAYSVAKFTEDFDFEAMNEKFNKEEIWGLLGRSTKGGSEDKDVDGDGEETYENDDQEEAGDGLLKADHKRVYCKDDFFDTLSCNTLDREPGEGKVKFSERRRIDKETFGEVHKHQRGRGIQGPRRAGGFQGSYRGRGYDNNAGKGREKTVWSRVT